MEKKLAFFLAVSITFVLAGNYYFFSAEMEKGLERVIVGRAIDGDTIEKLRATKHQDGALPFEITPKGVIVKKPEDAFKP